MFSASATHALRAVAWLAENGDEGPMLGRDLARQMKIPAHYLSKVLARLARAGVLEASRGAKGGYRLARPPGRIKLIEVVEPFEGRRARPGCLLRPGRPCRESGACSAHDRWSVVKDAYTQFLKETTVEAIQGGL